MFKTRKFLGCNCLELLYVPLIESPLMQPIGKRIYNYILYKLISSLPQWKLVEFSVLFLMNPLLGHGEQQRVPSNNHWRHCSQPVKSLTAPAIVRALPPSDEAEAAAGCETWRRWRWSSGRGGTWSWSGASGGCSRHGRRACRRALAPPPLSARTLPSKRSTCEMEMGRMKLIIAFVSHINITWPT